MLKRILKREKPTSSIGYAFFLFGLTLLTQLYHGFNFNYYLESGLVVISYATICKIVFVIVDACNDMLFGALSEKTKSKYGKRLPWLIYGLLFLPLFICLTYAINKRTNFSEVGFFLYYLIISILLENASTVIYTNYNALFPNFFTTGSARQKTATYKHAFEIAGMIVCYLLTPILVNDAHIPYWAVGIFYTVVYICTFITFISSSRFKDDLEAENLQREQFKVRTTFKDLIKEKPFLMFNLAQSCFQAILAIVVSLYPMYCKYVLKLETGWQQSLVLGCLFVSLMVSLPIWYFLMKKFSHTKIYIISYAGTPLALLLLLVPNNYIVGCILCCFIGPFLGGLMVSPDLIGADLIDIDKLKHHTSREAMMGSISSLIGRVSVILSAVATAILASAFGYQNGDNPGNNPELAFRICFGVMLPIVAFIGLIFAILYLYFSKNDRRVLKALKLKESDITREVNLNDIVRQK